jgi:hypothetical protein
MSPRLLGLSLAALVACGGETSVTKPASTVTTTLPGTPPSTATTTSTVPTVPLVEMEALPSHEDIQYTGRWDHTDPDAPWCGWSGASFEFNFHGTEVSALIDSGMADEWFRVIVDEDHVSSVKIQVSGQTMVPLAAGLSNGPHHIEVVKETYQGSNAKLLGLRMTTPDVGLLPPPPRPPNRIVFYGDSNLAGDSLEHEENNWNWEFVGTHQGMAGISARMLDAEYQNISTSGETLEGALAQHHRKDWWDSSSTYDFTLFPADAVVVNLGANNVGAPQGSIEAAYHALLDAVVVAHPGAHVVVFNGFGWDYNETANYTAEVVADRNDPNITVQTFPWVFEQWHGCQTDHAGMAAVLAEHLSQQLGWVVGPSDVMSGYGLDGGVANGSFENVSPFGGYGWRYFQDTGVSRIEDAASAQDGSFYVSLASGAQIHQPNPVGEGDTVVATLYLRGATYADTARVTLDFRDQEMWTTPLAIHPSQLVPGTSWQLFEVRADAPVGGLRPVFNTRLTVAAEAGGTIDVDHIEMRYE